MKYLVTITSTVTIEADSPEEAISVGEEHIYAFGPETSDVQAEALDA